MSTTVELLGGPHDGKQQVLPAGPLPGDLTAALVHTSQGKAWKLWWDPSDAVGLVVLDRGYYVFTGSGRTSKLPTYAWRYGEPV